MKTLFIFLSLLASCSTQSIGNHNEKVETKQERAVNVFPAIGTEVDQLPQEIWTIHQDLDGNMWFGGNEKGVYRYDGSAITLFSAADGLAGNQVRDIQHDKKGNILIETPTGISLYDGFGFTTLQPISSPNNAWALSDDDLWFNYNSQAHDVYRYDGEKLIELQLPKENLDPSFQNAFGQDRKGYSVFGIDKDSNGNLWIGTATSGVFHFDGKIFTHIINDDLDALADGRVPGIRCMVEDREGFMWLSNTISRYSIQEADENEPNAIIEKYVGIDMSDFGDYLPYFMSAIIDKDGAMWTASFGAGIWKYDGTNYIQIPFETKLDEVNPLCIYKDKTDQIWVGTKNAGVFTYRDGKLSPFETL